MAELLEIIVSSLAPLQTDTLEVIFVSLDEIPSILVQTLEATSYWTVLVSRNDYTFVIFSTSKNEIDR